MLRIRDKEWMGNRENKIKLYHVGENKNNWLMKETNRKSIV